MLWQSSPRGGIVNALRPFLIMVVFIVAAVIALVLFSYLLFWGILAGCVLYLIAWIKTAFFKKTSLKDPYQKRGNIYDHEE
ncbi:MAG: hypothetical protein K0R12_279 [Gammaproteobacteria bacterium]|jgi:uncharacterized membrane protein|nr:hypothetical protein [Gammaproteobacteria bacterium]